MKQRHSHSITPTRRTVVGLLLAATTLTGLLAACGGGGDNNSVWAASWYTAQSNQQESSPPLFAPDPARSLTNQTIRQVVYASGGGDRVRVKLSNLWGTAPVTFDAVTVAARVGTDANIDASTSRPVLFNGAASLTLAAGAEAFSDAVDFSVTANTTLTISIYVKNQVDIRTVHRDALQRNFVASGDVTTAAAPTWSQINDTAGTSMPGGFSAWVNELDVLRGDAPKVVVAFGDSITDGHASSPDGNKRWPNVLSRIVTAAPSTYGAMSVVDAGISGNRWKYDFAGQRGEARFGRDVLGVSGATHVVMLLGINDIGLQLFFPAQPASTSDITAAIQTAVDQAKAKGIKVIVGTLTPFNAAVDYSASGEAERQAVNAFIRTGLLHADAIVDLDKALRDSVDPSRLQAAYDSGDNIHPNDAGYAAMAQAVASTLAGLK